jgi:energy-coupling factor transporter ATP-binding protein EcfA2
MTLQSSIINETKTIICARDLESNPPATVTWINPQGEIVENDTRYQYQSSDNKVTLTIISVSEKDNGTWTCTISRENKTDGKNATIQLSVDGIGRRNSRDQMIIIIVCTTFMGIIIIIITKVPRQISKIARISKPQISNTFEHGVEITWAPDAGKVTSYVVHCETDPPGQQKTKETRLRVNRLLPNTKYVFKVCAVYEETRGPYSEESDPVTIAKPPISDEMCIAKPYASQVTHDSVTIAWEKHAKGAEGYIVTISYRALDHESSNEYWQEYIVKNTDVSCALITELKPQTRYIFKVQLDDKIGQQTVSDISDPILTETKEKGGLQTIAEILKSQSEKISSPGSHPHICQPKLVKVDDYNNVSEMSHKYIIAVDPYKSVDEFHTTTNERVLMLVGATGAGKSTLINGITNYVTDVRWQNDFRFKVIIDKNERSQAQSQTSDITAYTFCNSRLPYTLTVIDTPGFGDTRGMERDKLIVEQIKVLFSVGGIDQIHGIGFVTQASDSRLTPTQKYIFESVLSIFGKDIASNVFLLTTYADTMDPPVLSAIREAAIPYKAHYKFNNSSLFADNTKSIASFGELFWMLGMESFEQFFRELEIVEPHSLQLTRETLNERQNLEAIIEGLKMQIKVALAKIDVLRQKQYILRKREAEILQNQHFTYEVTVSKQRKIELPKNMFVTNCRQCEFTCHYPCPISEDNEKYRCKAMDQGGPDSARCTVCPDNCRWSQHVNAAHRFETYYEVETQTSDDLKKTMFEAIEGKSQIESTIADIENELKMLQDIIVGMVNEVKRSLERLQEIALKPNPMSEIEYIDLLIKAENSEKSPGFTERVKAFEMIKEIVKNQGAVAQSGKKINSTWWKDILARK